AAAFFGMVNGMGRDRGAALVLEQAVLPATTTDAERTRAFAWYNVLQDAGHAAGALLAALPAVLRRVASVREGEALRPSLLGPAPLLLPTAFLSLGLGRAVETPPRRTVAVTPETRRLVTRIAALFGLDSLGGGFLTAALVSLFFHERFGVSAGIVAPLFFAARVLNAASHVAAAALARRFGLLNTMVFTHIPSRRCLAVRGLRSRFSRGGGLFPAPRRARGDGRPPASVLRDARRAPGGPQVPPGRAPPRASRGGGPGPAVRGPRHAGARA